MAGMGCRLQDCSQFGANILVDSLLTGPNQPPIPHGSRRTWFNGTVWSPPQFGLTLVTGTLFLLLVPVCAYVVLGSVDAEPARVAGNNLKLAGEAEGTVQISAIGVETPRKPRLAGVGGSEAAEPPRTRARLRRARTSLRALPAVACLCRPPSSSEAPLSVPPASAGRPVAAGRD